MFRLTELDRRRLRNFRANRRAFWSLWIFLVLFVLSLFAEVLANAPQTAADCFVVPRVVEG